MPTRCRGTQALVEYCLLSPISRNILYYKVRIYAQLQFSDHFMATTSRVPITCNKEHNILTWSSETSTYAYGHAHHVPTQPQRIVFRDFMLRWMPSLKTTPQSREDSAAGMQHVLCWYCTLVDCNSWTPYVINNVLSNISVCNMWNIFNIDGMIGA